jgi:hypothetical protein
VKIVAQEIGRDSSNGVHLIEVTAERIRYRLVSKAELNISPSWHEPRGKVITSDMRRNIIL